MLIPIHKLVKDVPKNIETAIYNAMNVRVKYRTPDMISFAGELIANGDNKCRKYNAFVF